MAPEQVESTAARIPFHKPWILGTEIGYVAEAIRSGQTGGDGPFTRRCAALIEERLGIHKVLMTPSCTSALEMAALLCDLGPGDEVILPSFTFVSTANAFVRSGARPRFVEIRPDTLNIDEARIAAAITPRTRAIFPVHYAGVACEMDRIMEVAREHNLLVVEDAAQAVGGWYRGRALGSIGHLGAYSFHDTKNVVCGEGGALCCNSPALVERAEVLRDKGTNRAQFLRHEVSRYTWVDVGSSFIPAEIACAFLYGQLEALDAIQARHRLINRRYRERLEPLERQGLLRLPVIPEGAEGPTQFFFVIVQSEAVRDALIAHLRRHGVTAVFHFVPLHSAPMGARFDYQEGDLPVTENLSRRLLRLPSFAEITESQQERVASLITAFLKPRAVSPALRPAFLPTPEVFQRVH
jgi:dTDP-4-amino-4,6-dideoxygalactose transaminase